LTEYEEDIKYFYEQYVQATGKKLTLEDFKQKYFGKNRQQNIEQIMEYMGVTHDNARVDAYNHWQRFLEFCRDHNFEDWRHEIRPKLRSYIAVDYRYIDDYLESCIAWDMIELIDGALFFKGIPEDNKKGETKTDEG
jgi:hypothetical protein